MTLFTNAEMKAMTKRLQNDYSDQTGIFNSRVRPKLLEIQAWHTPKMRARIRKLLQYKYVQREDIPIILNEEKSFNEFVQEVGY